MVHSSEQEVLKAKFASALLPLVPWTVGQLVGTKYGHLISLSLDRPTKARVANIWKDSEECFGGDPRRLVPFLSPSFRRRWRNEFKRSSQEYLVEARKTKPGIIVNKGVRIIIRMWLKAGYKLDVGRIRKLAEIEREQLEPLEAFFANDQEVRQQIREEFSPSQCVEDPLIRNKLIQQCGGEESYFGEVINLLTEIAISPKLSDYDEHKRRLLKALGWDRVFDGVQGKQLDTRSLLRALKLLFFKLKVLEDEKTSLALLQKVVGRILVSRFVPYPYSKRKVISLAKPISDDLTVEDTLVDERAAEVFSDIEHRMVLDQSLELLSAAQRDDSRFFIEADEQGKSPEELRHELGDKKYKSKQRNFERAKKTLTNFRKSGRLPT